MKIEKLTENKIRVIINNEDLKDNHIDLHTLMTKRLESQNLFLEMLLKAEQEVGFHTDGCRLLIEAFSSTEDNLVFTITKYEKSNLTTEDSNLTPKKRLSVKRKCIHLNNTHAIYCFDKFDNFCDFCQFLNTIHEFESKKMSKDFSLYYYQNHYYLAVSNINITYPHLKTFYSSISEFGKCVTSSNSFQNKLLEHGKVIMKKNALNLGIKYFANNKEEA